MLIKLEKGQGAFNYEASGSELQAKQHTCTSSGVCNHYRELFTWMAALKF